MGACLFACNGEAQPDDGASYAGDPLAVTPMNTRRTVVQITQGGVSSVLLLGGLWLLNIAAFHAWALRRAYAATGVARDVGRAFLLGGSHNLSVRVLSLPAPSKAAAAAAVQGASR